MRDIEGFKQEEMERVYFTMEEIKELIATPWSCSTMETAANNRTTAKYNCNSIARSSSFL